MFSFIRLGISCFIFMCAVQLSAQEYNLMQLKGAWFWEWEVHQPNSDTLIKSKTPIDNTVWVLALTETGKGISMKNYLVKRGEEFLIAESLAFHDFEKNETHVLRHDGKGLVTYPSQSIILFENYNFDGTIRDITRIYLRSDRELGLTRESYVDGKPSGTIIKATGRKRGWNMAP
ncbi:MAG: hypothetical protein F6K19_04395 [Cyanothece sp. SIO1E1]|nr:hypothetical protein [Cyanothece sp. SIO1E1]